MVREDRGKKKQTREERRESSSAGHEGAGKEGGHA